MRQLLIVCGFSAIIFLFSNGVAMAQDVECDPFSIACGYTIQVGPFDIDVPIESIFPPQP